MKNTYKFQISLIVHFKKAAFFFSLQKNSLIENKIVW